MKKYLWLCATFVLACALPSSARLTAGAESYKSVYVCDAISGVAVKAENETKRLPIASMCKIMTLILGFEAVERGELEYGELITVSENASSMGGSQVYLDTGLSYRAEDLMRTIAVCSANDSCVALAERVAGSEQAFVARMNERARSLGANDTLFANCTGLPKETQYSCAKDVSVMFRELIKHEKYFEFSKVWLEEFAHPDGRTTTITNTNKLIRSYEGCDGGKTGFTHEAGFCLAATAKRQNTRLVSVIIGADSAKNRNAMIKNLFDETFSTHESRELVAAGQSVGRIAISGSKTREIDAVCADALCVFVKKGEQDGYTVEYDFPREYRAPVRKGDEMGNAVLYLNGVEVARSRLFAGQDAERFSWWDALKEGANNWN